MGDTSVIARRLTDGHVQYGWSGNGGYCANTGLRLLAWYTTPDRVEYLFSLGQVGGLGAPGSEHRQGFSRNRPTGTPHWLGASEKEIFSRIAFVDYGYLYDTDYRWYYICPGRLCVKLPLEMVAAHLEDGAWGLQEFTFLRQVQLRIVMEITGTLYQTDGSFREHAEKLGYTEDAMRGIASEAKKQLAEGHNPLYLFGEKHGLLLDWLDPWVVVIPSGEGTPGQVIFKPRGERHIETNEW